MTLTIKNKTVYSGERIVATLTKQKALFDKLYLAVFDPHGRLVRHIDVCPSCIRPYSFGRRSFATLAAAVASALRHQQERN